MQRPEKIEDYIKIIDFIYDFIDSEIYGWDEARIYEDFFEEKGKCDYSIEALKYLKEELTPILEKLLNEKEKKLMDETR